MKLIVKCVCTAFYIFSFRFSNPQIHLRSSGTNELMVANAHGAGYYANTER